MKLRTEMQNGCVHANGYCVDEDAVELRQAEMLVHDAAAAHALMQAMDEFYAAPLDSTLNTPEDAINWLEWRASELMREWGFDSVEDA